MTVLPNTAPRPPAGVLYITYDGLLEPLGASQVLPYVRGLAAAGVSMEILSFEKPEDLADAKGVTALEASLAAAGIGWTRKAYHRTPSVPATAWDVAAGRRHVAAWARRVRREGQRGVIHARSYVAGVMGLAGRGGGVGLLFDMRGFWVDERIEDGYWRPGSVPVRLARNAERRLLRSADQLIVLTHRSATRLPELAGRTTVPPWTVVPTCVDLEKFTLAKDPAAARASLGLGEGPVVIHIGTLKGRYAGRATMDVARGFLARTRGTFVVLTRDLPETRVLALEGDVPARIASVPPAEVPRWLSAADAGLALMRVAPSKDASFPTKVGEYLASGLAVVGTPVGDMDRLDAPDVLRLMRPEDDPEPVAAWLAQAAAIPGRAQRARALAEKALGLDQGVAALLGVYASMGVGARPHRAGGGE